MSKKYTTFAAHFRFIHLGGEKKTTCILYYSLCIQKETASHLTNAAAR